MSGLATAWLDMSNAPRIAAAPLPPRGREGEA